LDCPELIEDFEAKLAETNSNKRKIEQEAPAKKKKLSTVESQVRFEIVKASKPVIRVLF
jgi:hypothetical protein